jgi:protein-S-isoprenylcysteine O-methyltransferase Ste14
MAFDRILDWLPLVVLIGMMTTSRVRAYWMYRRGIRAIIVDWRRPVKDLLYDTLIIAVFLFWFCLLVAEAWPLSLDWLPDWLAERIFDATAAKIAGVALLFAAPILFAAALASMGTSWRIGIDQRAPGPLVTTGLFAWVRNPIYVAVYLLFVGTVLIHGRVVFLLLAAVLILLVHGVVRREERFLAKQYGDEFRDYCRRVGRYGL